MPSKQFTPDQSLSRQTQSTGKFQYVPLPKYDIQVHKHWVLPVSCNVSPTCLPVSSYWNILMNNKPFEALIIIASSSLDQMFIKLNLSSLR